MTSFSLFDKMILIDITVRYYLLMIDQLRQIAIFAKTIDHGSFRGAARELNLSPSVVSHHISQLEEHLGVALLYRSTRKLALTREGEQLLSSTHSMLDAVEDAFSQISNTAGTPSGELRIATPAILIQSHLTDLIASFSIRYPGVKINLEFSDERQELIAGGHDIAIRAGSQTESPAVTRQLFQMQRRLVASKSYLKGRPKVTTPDDIKDWDWIELTPVRHIKPSFRKSGSKKISIKPNAHISVNDALAMYRFARSGAGLAVVPEFLTEHDIASKRIEYVLPTWKIEPINIFATWPSNAPKLGIIKLFINYISEQKIKG